MAKVRENNRKRAILFMYILFVVVVVDVVKNYRESKISKRERGNSSIKWEKTKRRKKGIKIQTNLNRQRIRMLRLTCLKFWIVVCYLQKIYTFWFDFENYHKHFIHLMKKTDENSVTEFDWISILRFVEK